MSVSFVSFCFIFKITIRFDKRMLSWYFSICTLLFRFAPLVFIVFDSCSSVFWNMLTFSVLKNHNNYLCLLSLLACLFLKNIVTFKYFTLYKTNKTWLVRFASYNLSDRCSIKSARAIVQLYTNGARTGQDAPRGGGPGKRT